ncbi:hypothetical protein HZA73_11700 [candidate division TA06 bacterium]|nr:hypothetical protein [candidate division TA06 bacterium]
METDYSPAAVVAYPGVNSITVKWTPNSDAESQSGFGGYYVYCTTRANGFASLPTDSLIAYQIAGGLTATDSCTFDRLKSGEILQKGTIYYIAIRSMVDGALSGNSQTVMSSPRPEGIMTLYAYVTGDSTYCMMGFDVNTGLASKYKTLNRAYIDSVEDSTATPVSLTVNSYGNFGLAYNPPSFIRIGWSVAPAKDTTIVNRHTGVGLLSDQTTASSVDIIAQLAAGGTQVQMISPKFEGILLYDKWIWAFNGRTTVIQDLPGGWRTSTPSISGDSRSVVLTVGNAYQILTSRWNPTTSSFTNYYAKIAVDSLYDVVTVPNGIATKKVVLRYAYQTANDPFAGDVEGLNNF